ncbi:hypothetical protein C4J97_5368 [Pseudomonas orientalis]|nr:hypothetical protein C4J97_5368 [Pseudomonas orientalis]
MRQFGAISFAYINATPAFEQTCALKKGQNMKSTDMQIQQSIGPVNTPLYDRVENPM